MQDAYELVTGNSWRIDTLITCENGDRKIIQPIRITNRPSSKIKKGKQLSSTRLISKKRTGLILAYIRIISSDMARVFHERICKETS